MKNIKMRKRKSLHKNIQIKDALNTAIQPFKETASVDHSGKESAAHMNAHDLFSQYTADIIKKDTIFVR